MKRFVSIALGFGLVLGLNYNALAQASDTPAEPAEDNTCFELIGGENFDFGKVDQNETVEHVFEFKNNCDHVITIDNARASCGCTAAVISEKEVQPGETGKVNVKFTPPRMSNGKVTKTVSVYIQSDKRPYKVIRFSADVKTDLSVSPRHISLRGAVVGEKISQKLSLKNETEEPIAIEDPVVNVHSYTDTSSVGTRGTVAIPLETVQIEPQAVTIEPGQTQEFTVTLTPQYKGNLNGNVRFKSEKSETWLQIYGVVREKAQTDVRPE